MGNTHLNLYLVALLTLISATLAAQKTDLAINAPVYSPKMECSLAGTANMSSPSIDFYPYVKNISKIPAPAVGSPKAILKEIKNASNKGGKEDFPVEQVVKNTTPPTNPLRGTGFNGNPFDGIPNDNSLAISDNGLIVSVSNSQIIVYNEFGALLQQKSLDAFAVSVLGGNLKFDPRVIYDHQNDRFIVAFLNGRTPTTSQLVLGFSQTADPTGDWNLYTLTGNITGNSVADYPQIGISNKELFITANLTDSLGNLGFGSVIWQLGLENGYDGIPLGYRTIRTNLFALLPVSGSWDSYGPEFYFINSFNVPTPSSQNILLHRMTADIDAGGILEPAITLTSNISYIVPPDANQPMTGLKLSTNDCRVMDAYYLDDRIEFVMNTSRNARAAVMYGSITIPATGPASATMATKYIWDDSLAIAYPSIAYGGCTDPSTGEHSSVIGVNYSSNFHYPGSGAFYLDTQHNLSDFSLGKKGFTHIGSAFQNPFRWGDYTAVSSRKGTPGEVWMAGSYGVGASSHQSGTWIQQFFTECYAPVTIIESPLPQVPTVEVYPNPAPEFLTLRFHTPQSATYTAKLLDITGREVKALMNEFLVEGEVLFKFNTSPLARGTYLLQIWNQEKVIESQKIIIP